MCPIIDMEETGRRIRLIMELRGLTVRDIQKFLGLSYPQGVYNWFGGRNLPTIDNLYGLSELLQVPLDYLICGNRKFQDYGRGNREKRFLIYAQKLHELVA
ncbi:MAG: helix-turn-helix domain-containing protein [Lachnospiraceae bacterium]|nr:helix-turn-helix domain-containing protein [Lachnospiraceae bacterium]